MKSEIKWLIFFFLIAFCFRLFFILQTDSFTGDSAYYTLRQVESIKDTGHPLYYDDLSYGGRKAVFLSLFYYVLAFFSMFMPLEWVGKLIPNLFASSLVFVIYLLSMHITNDKKISLFTSFISIFIPVYLIETVNKVSVLSLLIPLLFLMAFFFLEIKKYSTFFVIGCFLLALISPLASVLALAFIAYAILAKVEDVKITDARLEALLFFIFITAWIYIITFKDAFLINGASVIWTNIPQSLLSSYFSSVNVTELMFLIGVVPFICGIYSVYRYFFVERSNTVYLFTSLALTIFILLFFRLITPSLGGVFLGVSLVVLMAPFLSYLFNYISHTKFASYNALFVIFVFIIFFFNSMLPSFIYAENNIKDSVSNSDLKALRWLQTNTPENSTILAPLEMGHLITDVAGRKNVADSNFLMVPDASIRVADISTVYNAKLKTVALEILTKYKANYIYVEEGDLSFVDKDCFRLVYKEDVKIYEVRCVL